MPLDDDFIKDLTVTVWSTVLGLEASETGPAVEDHEEIRTSVDITGAWEGTISLAFSRSLGRQLTAAMLACEESETTPDLIRDVVGELANVLGGNVKGVLPGPCVLSLPRVEAGTSSNEGPTIAQRVWFDCAGATIQRNRALTRARSQEPAMKILVVDDSKAMRMIIQRTLRQAGFDSHAVSEACNGAEALDALRKESFDLVLSDWNMPEMSGIELLGKVKGEKLRVQFGFITSEGTPAMRHQAAEAGAAFLIAKPFTVESFEQTLRGVLG